MHARQHALDFGPGEHFQALHGGHQCPVAIATKSSVMGFKQHVYAHANAPAMLQNLATGTDSTYLSQSGFALAGGRRTVGQVRALTSFHVDCDYYKLPELAGLTPDELLERVLVEFAWLPLPSYLVASGRGCYLIWTFNKPLGAERLADWQRAEDELVRLLTPFGADAAAKDAARILRVAGSFHEVAGERVSRRVVGSPVGFDEMAKLILAHAQPAVAPSFKPDKGKPVLSSVDGNGQRKKRPGKRLNGYQLALDRMADYRTLAELRGAPLSDYRARLLYCYAVSCCWYASSIPTLNDELLDFAELFFESPERYGPRAAKSVIDRFADDGYGKIVRLMTQNAGRYRATSGYLIRLLDITPDEQTHLRTIISTAEKRRRETAKRRATGMMSREQYRDRATDRRSEARRMRSEGAGVPEIAKALSVAQRTVYQLLKG